MTTHHHHHHQLRRPLGGSASHPVSPTEPRGRRAILIVAILGSLGFLANSSFAQAPANDNFANRKVLTGSHLTDNVSNVRATYESQEPNHGRFAGASWLGNTVWWSWTAPTNGMVTIDTLGSSFDTLLAVYLGNSLSTLRIVNANDSADDTSNRSLVRFPVTVGRVYQIVVDGNNSSRAVGDVQLNVNFVEDPSISGLKLTTEAAVSNDVFADRTVLSGGSVDAIGYSVGATYESGEPNHGRFTGNSWLGQSLWWAWTAPAQGRVTITTEGSTTQLGTPLDTLLAVYFGRAVGALQPVAANDDADDARVSSMVSFPVTAGRVYQIVVDGNSKSAETGNVILHVAFTPEPGLAQLNITTEATTGNDLFANRPALKGRNVSAIGYNLGAGYEPGEPAHDPKWLGATLWWSWVAESSDEVQITTRDSDFDTVIAVYTGKLINQLTRVAANNDEGAGRKTSLVRFRPIPGQVYQIAVDSTSSSGSLGAVVLSVQQSTPFTTEQTRLLRAVEVQYDTLEGRRYQLWRSPDFMTWSPDGQPFIGNGLTYSRLISAEGRRMEYYRILPVP